jgi:hypothetical protein
MNKELIKQLAEGKIAVKNDDKVDLELLEKIFSKF